MSKTLPARLDIKDMPRDTTRALGGLRQALCASFNYCRKYPNKMTVLKAVLKYTYNRVVQFEKQQQEILEAKERKVVLADAAKLGLDLDERLGTDKLKALVLEATVEDTEE